jgi:tetratricopeptide (TPR) repeat protein
VGDASPACKPVKQHQNFGAELHFLLLVPHYIEQLFFFTHTRHFLPFLALSYTCPAMGKPRPQKKKSSKSSKKSVLGPGGSISKAKMSQDPSALLDQATILLQTGRVDEALATAQEVLDLAAGNASAQLQAVNLLGEINVELGEIDTAREYFLSAVQQDPNGSIPEAEGGGAEKFLWLAQLSEQGGADSVQWFEKGVSSLRQTLQQLEGKTSAEDVANATEKKTKMANALCAVAEIYMTDLS